MSKQYSKKQIKQQQEDEYIEPDEVINVYYKDHLLLSFEYKKLAPTYSLQDLRELMNNEENECLNFRFLKSKNRRLALVNFNEEEKTSISQIRQILKDSSNIKVTLIAKNIPLTFPSIDVYSQFLIELFERENRLTSIEPSPEFVGNYQIESQNEITTRILITSSKVTKLQSMPILELILPISNPKFLKGKSH